ncbi:MAG: chorismate mutase [Fibrobacteria bacterium]
MELGDWRKRIDALNLQLLELLNERAKCAQAIAELKKKKMLPIYDPLREQQVFEAVLGKNDGPLTDEAIRRIFECIILEHRRLEEHT